MRLVSMRRVHPKSSSVTVSACVQSAVSTCLSHMRSNPVQETFRSECVREIIHAEPKLRLLCPQLGSCVDDPTQSAPSQHVHRSRKTHFTPKIFALSTISTLFLLLTPCAIDAAYLPLCMSKSSSSERLWTRNSLWPEGIMWRVFLLEP
jgi:hypothetical protein